MSFILLIAMILLATMAIVLLTKLTANYKANLGLSLSYLALAYSIFYQLMFREHTITALPVLRDSHILILHISAVCMRGYIEFSSGHEIIVKFKSILYLVFLLPGTSYFVLGHWGECHGDLIIVPAGIGAIRLVMFLTGLIFSLYHIVCCFCMVASHQTGDVNDGKSLVTWHKILMRVFAVISAILFAGSVDIAFHPFVAKVLNVMLCLLVLSLLLWQSHHSFLFFGTEQKQPACDKYANSALNDQQLQVYAQRLINLVEQEKCYLNPCLTRNELAKMMGISPHHLSQVFTRKFHKNFNDFINQYRVIRAVELLSQPQNERFTIESIADECGFQNRVTFFSVFKKHTGQSPAEYRKAISITANKTGVKE